MNWRLRNPLPATLSGLLLVGFQQWCYGGNPPRFYQVAIIAGSVTGYLLGCAGLWVGGHK